MSLTYEKRLLKFQKFAQANPTVNGKLLKLAREAKAAGLTRIGMSLLFGHLRYTEALRTKSTDGFKLNNDLAPFYARALMTRFPELDGLFEIRDQE